MKRIVTPTFFFSMLLYISCESHEKAYEYTGNDSIKIQTIKEIEEMGFTIVRNKKGDNPMQITEEAIDLFVAFKKYHQNLPKVDTTIVFQTTVKTVSTDSILIE